MCAGGNWASAIVRSFVGGVTEWAGSLCCCTCWHLLWFAGRCCTRRLHNIRRSVLVVGVCNQWFVTWLLLLSV
jgi:hypothetical protein